MRYLSRQRGAQQATVRQIGRVVFEGSANPNYRALVQSLLLDYLGLAKTGRETRTLVELFPEFFLVAGENAQGEGAIVTLRDDASVASTTMELHAERKAPNSPRHSTSHGPPLGHVMLTPSHALEAAP